MASLLKSFQLKGLKKRIVLVGSLIALGSLFLTGTVVAFRVTSLLEYKAELEMKVAANLLSDQFDYRIGTYNRAIVEKSQSKIMQDSVVRFSRAYDLLDSELIEDSKSGFNGVILAKISKEYSNFLQNVLIKSLKISDPEGKNGLNELSLRSAKGKVLQYFYNVKNPSPVGKKYEKNSISDLRSNKGIASGLRSNFVSTTYAKTHEIYHEDLNKYRKMRGLEDIKLVNKKGYIVYSAAKSFDFGGNLLSGPQSKSSLGEAFQAVHNRALDGDLFEEPYATEYRPYALSYNNGTIFISYPIYSIQGDYTGVVIYKIPKFFQELLSFKQNHEYYGLGKTGEALLIDEEGLVLSKLRHTKKLTAGTRKIAGPYGENVKSTADLSLRLSPEALRIVSNFPDSSDVTMGIYDDYLGEDSVFSSKKINFFGTKAILIVHQEEKEVLAQLFTFLNFLMFLNLGLIGIAFIIFYTVGGQISRPISQAASSISTTSAEMASTIDEQERTTSQQSAAVNQTSTTMEELERNSSTTAEQADSVAENTQIVLEKTQQGTDMVYESLEGMQGVQSKVQDILDQIVTLSDKTEQIKNIANLVRELADETHMLALNAAVEAARAGEHGKGFAVVALEIRRLADESKKSAEKIDNLVTDILKANHSTVMAAEDGSKQIAQNVKATEETSGTFNAINESMNQIAGNISEITNNIRQQAMGIVDVVKAMNVVNAGAKESAAGMAQTQNAIHQLNDAATTLKKLT